MQNTYALKAYLKAYIAHAINPQRDRLNCGMLGDKQLQIASHWTAKCAKQETQSNFSAALHYTISLHPIDTPS